MKIAITDANIFIDLTYLGMLDLLFSIELEIHTTREVFDELNEGQQGELIAHEQQSNITFYSFTIEEQEELQAFEIYRGLSFSDNTVIFLANKIGATVISGDNKIRKACKQKKVEVHGILWLFDMFIEHKLIDTNTAISRLSYLMQFNKWLPVEECNKRIAGWR